MTVTPDGRALHEADIAQNSIGHEGEVKPYVMKLADIWVDVFGNTAFATFVREYHGKTGEAQGKVARESVVSPANIFLAFRN